MTPRSSRNIVVPASTDLVDDSFTRTVAGGWGSADVGGAWTVQSDPSSFAVNGTEGRITVPAGADRHVDALGPSVADVDQTMTVNTDRLPAGGSHLIALVARRQSTTLMYRSHLRITPDGSVFVGVDAGSRLLGTETEVPGLHRSDGPIRLRAQVIEADPTFIEIKAWAASLPEPDSWTEIVADSTPELQERGTTGVHVTSTEAAGPSVAVSVDDYVARPALSAK